MIVDRLLKLFDDLAASSDQIPAIRRLIFANVLHTALNAQDAASRADLLRDLHATKHVGAREKLHEPANVSSDDLPSALANIPAQLFERLENIASIEKGLSQIQSNRPGNYPLVVTAETRSTSKTYEFQGPATIVPLVSSTGHGDASLKRIHYQEGKYAVGNILAVIQPLCPEAIQARFLFEYLSSFKDELLVSRMVGTANVSLTINKLKEVPVPLVSGDALQRIDELMALCDRLEAQHKERERKHAVLSRAALARFAEAPTPANLGCLFHDAYAIDPTDIRNSIRMLAMQGKLVERIKSEGSAGDGIIPTKTSSSLEDLPVLRRHWRWFHLEEVVTRMDSGWSPACPPYPAEVNSWGVLRTTAVQPLRYLESANKALPRTLVARPDCEVANGDLLFTRCGPTNRVGITCVARPTRAKLMISDKIIRIHFVDGIDPDFAALALSAGHSSAVIEELKSGMAASQVNISQPKLKGVPIPVPPFAEQLRIVAKVAQLMALVDQLESKLAVSRVLAEKLMEAVVAELTKPPVVLGTAISLVAVEVKAAASDVFGGVEQYQQFVRNGAMAADYLPGQVACYIADALRGDANLGRTKLEKINHLVEYHAGVPLNRHAKPYLYGPVDYEQLRRAEEWAAEEGAFATNDPGDRKKVTYTPGPKLEEIARLSAATLGDRKAEVDRIIDLLRGEDTRRCEIFATVYAAWNDLLLRGVHATDPAIMDEIRTNWHERKKAFSDKAWRIGLRWLRLNKLIPTGTGRAVAVQKGA